MNTLTLTNAAITGLKPNGNGIDIQYEGLGGATPNVEINGKPVSDGAGKIPSVAQPPSPLVPGVSDPIGNWSREEQFVNGGLRPFIVPERGQEIGLRGIKEGPPMSFGPFRVDNMPAGSGSIALAEFAGGGIVGSIAIATEPGVFVGPSILDAQEGQVGPRSIFVTGKQGGGGYGPQLPAGTDLYITVGFGPGTTATTAILQIHPPV